MELKDTIPGMLSDDHKERLIAEYQQLIIRARRLKNTIDAAEDGRLDYTLNTPIELLKTQYEYMTCYIGTLVKRMAYEGINNIPTVKEA